MRIGALHLNLRPGALCRQRPGQQACRENCATPLHSDSLSRQRLSARCASLRTHSVCRRVTRETGSSSSRQYVSLSRLLTFFAALNGYQISASQRQAVSRYLRCVARRDALRPADRAHSRHRANRLPHGPRPVERGLLRRPSWRHSTRSLRASCRSWAKGPPRNGLPVISPAPSISPPRARRTTTKWSRTWALALCCTAEGLRDDLGSRIHSGAGGRMVFGARRDNAPVRPRASGGGSRRRGRPGGAIRPRPGVGPVLRPEHRRAGKSDRHPGGTFAARRRIGRVVVVHATLPTGRRFARSSFPWTWSLLLGLAAASIFVALDFSAASAANPNGDWDATAIWNLRARFMAGGAAVWRRAISAEAGGFMLSASHPGYPLFLSSFIGMLWTLAGDFTAAAPAVTSGVIAFAVMALLTGSLAARRSLGLGLLGGLLLLATELFASQSAAQYADLLLALAFLAATVLLDAAAAESEASAAQPVADRRGARHRLRPLDQERRHPVRGGGAGRGRLAVPPARMALDSVGLRPGPRRHRRAESHGPRPGVYVPEHRRRGVHKACRSGALVAESSPASATPSCNWVRGGLIQSC